MHAWVYIVDEHNNASNNNDSVALACFLCSYKIACIFLYQPFFLSIFRQLKLTGRQYLYLGIITHNIVYCLMFYLTK